MNDVHARRLFIVDPALKSLSGHPFEYASAVAQAANARGFATQIHGHWDLGQYAERSNVIRAFGGPQTQQDDIAHTSKEPQPKSLEKPARDSLAAKLLAHAQRSDLSWTLFPSIRSLGQFFARSRNPKPLNGPIWSAFENALEHSHEWRTDDLVFFPTLTADELDLLLKELSDAKAALPEIHLMLRRDPTEAQTTSERALRRFLRQLSRSTLRLRLWTDTDALKARYKARSDWPKNYSMGVLPIPFRTELIDRAEVRPSVVPVVGVLGGARLEKGYGLLPKLIEDFSDELDQNEVRFVIHTHVGHDAPQVLQQILKRLDAAAKRWPRNVRLIPEALTPEAYYRELKSLSAVLIPYVPAYYGARSSGILAEALSAGLPVVVSEPTWMSQVTPPPLCETFSLPSRLSYATRRLLEALPERTARARDYAPYWRKQHSPEKLIEILSTSAQPERSR